MRTIVFTLIAISFAGVSGYGQQLVYTPVNPNFGGNPMNYSGLLASANAQNQFDDKNNLFNSSLLDNFSETVKRQILSQLSRKLLDRKSTRLNSSHVRISYAVFCLKKKNNNY